MALASKLVQSVRMKTFFEIPLDLNDPVAAQERAQIRELLEYDRYCRDNGHFEQMAECYSEESVIRVSWFTGSGKEYCRRLAEAGGGGAKHKVNYTVVWPKGDKAIAEMTTSMLSPRLSVDGGQVDLVSYARILTRVHRDADGWKILQGDCIYERDEIIPVAPGTDITVLADELSGYRPSYQGLCYVLARTGQTSDQDLPGEDRPETIAALYDEASAWLLRD